MRLGYHYLTISEILKPARGLLLIYCLQYSFIHAREDEVTGALQGAEKLAVHDAGALAMPLPPDGALPGRLAPEKHDLSG
jgi:hypothetical protein